MQLGCGITGLVCAELLEKNEKVDEIVLADNWTKPAEDMKRRVKSDKLSVARVDASDIEAVKKLVKGADILVCAVPFRMIFKVMQAVIPLGVNYIEFSSSDEHAEALAKLRKMCKDSGAIAITAMGSDPGISDVFARYAANKLDRPEEAYVRDGDNGSAEGYEFFSLWSPVDMLEEVTVPAAVFRNGKIEYLPPLHEREIYEFPEPIGPLPVYNTLHEETFLMSQFIKGIKRADFKIAVDDGFAKTATMLRKMGMASLEPVDVKGVKVRPIDVVVSLMPRPTDLAGKVKGQAGIVAEVIGWKDGKRKMVKVWSIMSHEDAWRIARSSATGFMVGAGGALGAGMILDGSVKEPGFYVPEQLPAEEFVRRLPTVHLEAKEEVKDLG
ncbi:MAG TPA: saccharopine dehydrogenase C-terminal domain-containing protein [Thermoplasmata archaeon]